MKAAQMTPALITSKFPATSTVPKDPKSKFVVIITTPTRLKSTPATFLRPKRSFKVTGLIKATHTTLRLTKSDEAKASV